MVVVPCSTVDTCNIWETEQLRSERVHRIVDHRTAIDTDIDVKWPSLCCRDTRFWGVYAQVLGLLSPQGTTEEWIGLPQYRHFVSTRVWACGPDLINDCMGTSTLQYNPRISYFSVYLTYCEDHYNTFDLPDSHIIEKGRCSVLWQLKRSSI